MDANALCPQGFLRVEESKSIRRFYGPCTELTALSGLDSTRGSRTTPFALLCYLLISTMASGAARVNLPGSHRHDVGEFLVI